MNLTMTRSETRISKVLVAILLVAAMNLGVITAARRADAAVTYTRHPIAGWSTNGPVRAVKIVGDTVYVGGDFSQVRGPGGSPVVARTDLFAISRTTGALVAGFVANANGVVRALDSDGTNLYVGGQFTTINSTTRRYAAAVNLGTGAVTGFNPNAQSWVYGLAVRGNSVYLGGVFSAIGGIARANAALVNKNTGALDNTWNPGPNGAVRTFAFSPNGSRIYVGGDYTSIAGTAQAHLVALDPVTGTRFAVVFGQFNAPVLDLDVDPDGTRVYAALGGTPGDGNRTVAWNASSGTRLWRQEADGDNQAVEYTNGEVYYGFHEGFGGNPLRHILGSDAATGAIDPNFQPDLNSFWGVWSIDATGGTLAVGGEFTTFDGVSVQGIALLPSLSAADNNAPSTPANLISTGHTSSTVSLGWTASTDDTQVQGYEVFRDGTQVGFSTSTSFTDTDLAPSSDHTYTVRAADLAGNESAPSGSVTVRTSLPLVLAGSNWRYLDNGSDQGTAWRVERVQRHHLGDRAGAARLRRR